jgi:tetratricopeptide (TPR) repeat protein
MAALLFFDTTTSQVAFRGVPLELETRWVRFLGLLGLVLSNPEVLNLRVRADGLYYVGVDLVGRLAGFESLAQSSGSLGTKLRAFVREDLPRKAAGAALIVSPRGATEKLFRLDTTLVKVGFDCELAGVLEWLGLAESETTAVGSVLEVEEMFDLSRCEALFEARQIAEAEAELEALIVPEASNSLAARALLLRSQIRERQGLLAEAVELHNRAVELSQIESGDVALTQLVELQSIRLSRAQHDLPTAGTRVRALLERVEPGDHYVRARLLALQGLLHLDDRRAEPKGAEGFFLRAFEHAMRSRWWWGVQAMAANLGLLWFRQVEHHAGAGAQLRAGWLEQSRLWFERAVRFTSETGFRHDSPEALIYLAKVLALQGQALQALEVLDQATGLAHELGTKRDLLEIACDQAELFWADDAPELAHAAWTEAFSWTTSQPEQEELRRRVAGRVLLEFGMNRV